MCWRSQVRFSKIENYHLKVLALLQRYIYKYYTLSIWQNYLLDKAQPVLLISRVRYRQIIWKKKTKN